MRGGIVFGSAGNDGVEPESHYPASLDNVIAVAALDPAFKKSDYSIMQSGSILQHPEAETDMAGRCGAVPETITTWNWWELRRQHLWLREWQP